jgi:hypothetical protein
VLRQVERSNGRVSDEELLQRLTLSDMSPAKHTLSPSGAFYDSLDDQASTPHALKKQKPCKNNQHVLMASHGGQGRGWLRQQLNRQRIKVPQPVNRARPDRLLPKRPLPFVRSWASVALKHGF